MDETSLLKHPKEQKFYKVLAFLACIVGLNTQHWGWYSMPTSKLFRIQRIIVIIFIPLTSISELLYLFVHYKELKFSSLATIFSVIPVSALVTIKIVLAQTTAYKTVMIDFMDKIHLHTYCHTLKTNFGRKTLFIAEKQFRVSFFVFMFLCYSSFVFWQAIPIINNIQRNTDLSNITFRLEICIHVWLPFDYEFDFYKWSIVQAVIAYGGFLGMTVFFCFDSINLAFIYHLTGHINVIEHLLKTGFSDEILQRNVKEKLVELTRYYQFISQTLKKVETAFGVNIAATYGLNLVMGSILLYQFMTSDGDAKILMTYGLMIPIYTGMLIIMSFALENVRIQADVIPDYVYQLRWEKMSISNQKMILTILCQVQPMLEFKAAFNIKTGVQPAINILKTTFSYYVMIKSKI